MRKSLLILLPLALLMGSCTQELEKRLTDVENRLTTLEDKVKELNSQVTTINQLLSGKFFIQSVETLEDGYKLTLINTNGETSVKTIVNGKDGNDGKTPDISVALDQTDGNYYWTVNGEWILVGGQRVRANGIDGQDGNDGDDAPVPQFTIEDGNWYMRYEGGEWFYVGPASSSVDGLIVSIDADTRDDVVLIALAGGTVIEVPKASAAVKLQIVMDDSVFQNMEAGQTQSAAYEVKAPIGITYTLESYEPDGWAVTISEPKNNKGAVTVTLPKDATSGKVILVANGSDGSSYVRVINVGVKEVPETVIVQEMVDATGGSISLPSGASDVVIPSGVNWISKNGSKLNISANNTYDSRTAVITFKVGEKDYSLTVVQFQKDAFVLSSNELTAKGEGETITFIIKTNVEVSAQADVDWLAVAVPTKGLEDKPYYVIVSPNFTGEPRTGTITFYYGDLTPQTVTVTQEKRIIPVTERTEIGGYFGDLEFVYETEADQYVRSYNGKTLTFALVEVVNDEQMVISGYSTDMVVGDIFTLSVDWKQGGATVLSQQYTMAVLLEANGKVWIGDDRGRGVVIKK